MIIANAILLQGRRASNPDPGLLILTTSEKAALFYDMTTQLGTVGNPAAASYDNLGPLTAPIITSDPVDPPTIDDVQINETLYKAALTNANPTGFLIDHNGAGVYDRSFDWFISFVTGDGQPTTQYRVHGGFDIAGSGGTGFQCFVTTSGQLQFAWRVPTQANSIAFRTDAVLPNGQTGQALVRVQLDFENDTVKVWFNGIAQTVTSITGNIADYDPADWGGSIDLGLGCYNLNGTITSPGVALHTLRHAVTDKLTDLEAAHVTNYLMLQ